MKKLRAATQILGMMLGGLLPVMAQQPAGVQQPAVFLASAEATPALSAAAEFRPAPAPASRPLYPMITRPQPSLHTLARAASFEPLRFAAVTPSGSDAAGMPLAGLLDVRTEKNAFGRQVLISLAEMGSRVQLAAFHIRSETDVIYPGAAYPVRAPGRTALELVNQDPETSHSFGLSVSFRFGRR